MKGKEFKRVFCCLIILAGCCFFGFAKDVPYELTDIKPWFQIYAEETYMGVGATITNLGQKEISAVYIVMEAFDTEDEDFPTAETQKRQDMQISIPAGESFVAKASSIESYGMMARVYEAMGIYHMSPGDQFQISLKGIKSKEDLKSKKIRVYLSSIDYVDGTEWFDYSGEVCWEVPVYEENNSE